MKGKIKLHNSSSFNRKFTAIHIKIFQIKNLRVINEIDGYLKLFSEYFFTLISLIIIRNNQLFNTALLLHFITLFTQIVLHINKPFLRFFNRSLIYFFHFNVLLSNHDFELSSSK